MVGLLIADRSTDTVGGVSIPPVPPKVDTQTRVARRGEAARLWNRWAAGHAAGTPDRDPTRIGGDAGEVPTMDPQPRGGVDEPRPVRLFWTAPGADPHTFSLHGELDVATVGELQTLPATVRDEGLVLDVTELSFIDSTGLSALVSLHRRLADVGGHLVLRHPRANVRRVLEVSGLDQLLTVEA
jgi:anti-sigma B factor antagonist